MTLPQDQRFGKKDHRGVVVIAEGRTKINKIYPV